MVVQHGENVFHRHHNVLQETVRQHIRVVFIDNFVLNFTPKQIDQTFDLQFKPQPPSVFLIQSVDFVNGKTVTLCLRLFFLQRKGDSRIELVIVIPVLVDFGEIFQQQLVEPVLIVNETAFQPDTD